MEAATTTQARHFCFTQFIDTGEDGFDSPSEEDIMNIVLENDIRYLIMGLEECPDTGRWHWQGYMEFKSPLRYSKIIKMFKGDWPTIRCFKRNGPREKARDYCKKDENFYEFGKWEDGGQGNRTDIRKFCERIDNGELMGEIAYDMKNEYVKFNRGFEKYKMITQNLKKPKYFPTTETHIYWGKAGRGKTSSFIDKYDRIFCPYITKDGTIWFDGYDDHDVIMFDEFKHSVVDMGEILQICDRCNTYMPPVKGGFTVRKWTKIVFTSNIDPRLWTIAENEEQWAAFCRRVTICLQWVDGTVVQSGLGNSSQATKSHLKQLGIEHKEITDLDIVQPPSPPSAGPPSPQGGD